MTGYKPQRPPRSYWKKPQYLPKNTLDVVLLPLGAGKVDIVEWRQVWTVTYKGVPCFIRWDNANWNKKNKHHMLFADEWLARNKSEWLNRELETQDFSWMRIYGPEEAD